MRRLLCVAALTLACQTVPQRTDASPRAVPVFDGHVDTFVHLLGEDGRSWRPPEAYDLATPREGQVDLPRLREGHVAGGIFTIAILDQERRQASLQEATSLARAVVARHPELRIVTDAAALRQTVESGRRAVLLGIEGGDQLGSELDALLPAAHAQGVRALTLMWERTNLLGDSHSDTPRHGGLSPDGERAVRLLNDLGMLVDLSHASEAAVLEAVALSRAPILLSHTGARAIADLPRNVSDEVLRAIAARGGLIMVPFVPYLVSAAHHDWFQRGEAVWAELKARHGDSEEAKRGMAAWEQAHPPPPVKLGDVADHLDHIRRIAGVDHVGLGSDFDGMSFRVEGLEDASRFQPLLEELRSRGWTEAEVRKVAFQNFLRVLEAVEVEAVGRSA